MRLDATGEVLHWTPSPQQTRRVLGGPGRHWTVPPALRCRGRVGDGPIPGPRVPVPGVGGPMEVGWVGPFRPWMSLTLSHDRCGDPAVWRSGHCRVQEHPQLPLLCGSTTQHRAHTHTHTHAIHPTHSRFLRHHPTMKISSASLLALLLPAASARFVEPGEPDRVLLFPDGVPQPSQDTQKYHIELAPGDTRWVTEEEKWELRRVSFSFVAFRRLRDADRFSSPRKTARQALLRHHRQSRAGPPPRPERPQEGERLPREAQAAGRGEPAAGEAVQDGARGAPDDLYVLPHPLLQGKLFLSLSLSLSLSPCLFFSLPHPSTQRTCSY